MTELNLRMVRGGTLSFTTTIRLNGSPVNLTGGTLYFTAKWNYADLDAAAAFQITSTLGANGYVQVTGAVDGQLFVSVYPPATASLPNEKIELVYDLKLNAFGGLKYYPLRGTLTILPAVTLT